MKRMKLQALYLISFVLIASLTFLPGCITLPNAEPAPDSTVAAVAPAPIVPNWTPPAVSNNTPTLELPGVADVVARVKPSVVSINTEVTAFDFFNRQYTEEGAGSGWIIDPNGIIVTNNHVVEGAKSITVVLDNGDSYSADIKSVATDALNDLAIVKINATNLPALKIGDSTRLRVGDWVIAIGNSLGRGTRATLGIVSQLNVSLDVDTDQTLYNLIDTSAAINPGNSGGPLVNLAGEVIGITSAKIVDTGTEATGFAISSQTATPIIQALVTNGFVSRPWVGVGLYTVDSMAVRQLKLAVNSGVAIIQISDGSPAALAGLQKYDVIVSIDGQDVSDVAGFTHVLNTRKIGQPCDIKYWRGTIQNTVKVTPIEKPAT
jgi:serine protease Do